MKTIHDRFKEYHKTYSHSKTRNIRYASAPIILFSLIGMLYDVKLYEGKHIAINGAMVFIALLTTYFFTLSRTLWIGILLLCLSFMAVCVGFETYVNFPLWQISAVMFMCGWAALYSGHQFERKKAPLAKALHFLLIGIAYMISSVYYRLRIAY